MAACPWLASARFVGIRGAGLVGNPVDLPRFAAIGGERLLKVRSCAHVCPAKSDKYRFVIDGVYGEELAYPILELADLRWINTPTFLLAQ
jgi:hypothetical protein